MRSGKLGIVVLIIALSATLMASWVMSMDVEEREVTKYNPLADITGEFQTERTPDYIRYDPSTNSTGYFTDGSVIDGTRYFDGVEYKESNPNNYRLDLPPLDSYVGSLDLSTLTGNDGVSVSYANTDGPPTFPFTAKSFTIDQLAVAMGYSDWDRIIIVDAGDPDWTTGDARGEWISFAPKSWKGLPSGVDSVPLKNPTVEKFNGTGSYKDDVYYDPVPACVYDLVNRTVELFKDKDMKISMGVFDPTDVWILYGRAGGMSTYYLGTEIDVTAYDFPDPKYLDPAAGVELS